MAKHNLILGTASGSVGDVTMYRREGVQVNRARVREIANPKTNAQAQQRNFLAPVAKFYAPLSTVLEKSYEGLNKSKSYSAFLKKNIDLARTNGWYLPKGTPFFPLPYQLSRGSIQPISGELVEESNAKTFCFHIGEFVDVAVNTLTVGQTSQAAISGGYQEGDQVTVILIADNGNGEYFPVYCRFYLQSESTVLLKDALPNMQLVAATPDGIYVKQNDDNFTLVAAACIISRYENGQWRRSTQQLIVDEDIMNVVVSGEQAQNTIRSYQDNNYTPTSEVYLNGSDETILVVDSQSRRRVLTGLTTTQYISTGGGGLQTILAVQCEDGGKLVVCNDIDSDANYGKAIKDVSSWTDNVFHTEPFLPLRDMTGSLAQWLMSQGVAQSVFQ